MRVLIGVIGGAVMSLLLFGIMDLVTKSDDGIARNSTPPAQFDFTRFQKEDETTRKTRVRPKKPPKPLPKPTPKVAVNTPTPTPTTTQQRMPMPKIDLNMRLSGNDILGGAMVGSGGSMELIPLVRIPPLYPRQALRLKKEGFVKVAFTITKEGLVKSPRVLEANPKRIFDRAALTAIRKWKFKPKMVEGKAVEQEGVQVLEFKLKKRGKA